MSLSFLIRRTLGQKKQKLHRSCEGIKARGGKGDSDPTIKQVEIEGERASSFEEKFNPVCAWTDSYHWG